MSKHKTIILKEDQTLQLTTSKANGQTCIYVSVEKDKLVIAGGSSIVKRIEGKGFQGKIERKKKAKNVIN